MLILGINAFHSDASAAILQDGQLAFAVAEERLNRIKHFGGFPTHAIRACLDHVGASIGDIDHIAVGRNPDIHLRRKLLYGAAHPRMLLNLTRMRLAGKQRFTDLRETLATELGVDPGLFRFQQHNVEHHVAHIASAFFCSPFSEAAGFSYDGSGDWVSVMSARCRDNQIEVLDRVFVPHSLGNFYSALSQFIGYQKYGDEGKVMGLAALGDPSLYETVAKMISEKDDAFRLNLSYFQPTGSTRGIKIAEDGRVTQPALFSQRMAFELGEPRSPGAEITKRDMDVAHAMQKRFEEITLGMLRRIQTSTSSTQLAMAGGCALNSVVNGKILDETAFEKTWIQPAAGDEGLSAGAALYCYHSVLGYPRSYVMENAYLGPIAEEHAIERSLKEASLPYERLSEKELLERTARHIVDGKIIGWFQGRTEWGPRALGNRSILTHPGLPDMKDVLNSRIKQREWFRPFAPAILKERTVDYFVAPEPSPFMLHAFPVRPERHEELQAVTHVDGTGRVQTVERSENPLYYSLIETFGRISGTPVLLNTSFNENEPIVSAPSEAVDCFQRTKMDVLCVGPFIVERKDESSV